MKKVYEVIWAETSEKDLISIMEYIAILAFGISK